MTLAVIAMNRASVLAPTNEPLLGHERNTNSIDTTIAEDAIRAENVANAIVVVCIMLAIVAVASVVSYFMLGISRH